MLFPLTYKMEWGIKVSILDTMSHDQLKWSCRARNGQEHSEDSWENKLTLPNEP